MKKSTLKTREHHALESLGLNENEAGLYLLMLKHPRATVQELQQLTPFPRTLLYYILNRLVAIRLVSSTKDSWRTTYTAENPERLYDLLAERRRGFQTDALAVEQMIPELKNKYHLAQKRPGVQLFEGLNGYKTALEQMLRDNPEILYTYTTIAKKQIPGIEIRDDIERHRLNKRIKEHMLLFETPQARALAEKRKLDDYTWIRFVQEKIEAFTVDMRLWNGKILYTTHDGREPTAMLIENKELFEMQKSLFGLLWKSAQTP